MRTDIIKMLDTEMRGAYAQFGEYNSPHELYGVIKEELDEYFDSVRQDEESLYELLQVAAVALRYIHEQLEYDSYKMGEMEADQMDRWTLDE